MPFATAVEPKVAVGPCVSYAGSRCFWLPLSCFRLFLLFLSVTNRVLEQQCFTSNHVTAASLHSFRILGSLSVRYVFSTVEDRSASAAKIFRKFITAFTAPRHWSLSKVNLIPPPPPPPFFIICRVIPPPPPYIYVLQVLTFQILNILLFFPMRYSHPAIWSCIRGTER
jgi:hypothetical protein